MQAVSALVLLLFAGVITAAPTAHVVLIIGQSNSVGYNSGGHTSEDVAYPNILQTSCCTDDGGVDNNNCKLVEGQDPLHHGCDAGYLNGISVGFGMSFAREYRGAIPDDDIIVLVPAGIGGTGFNDNTWTAYNGTGFVQAVARLKSTFNALPQQYPQHTAVLEGILWHQGENDADALASDYLNKDLIPMILALRDTNLIPQTSSSVPFVVGDLVPSWVGPHPEINAALMLVDQFVPYSASTPSQGLIGDVQDADRVHFTAASQRIFGRRYYAGFKLAQTNIPSSE